MGRGDIHRPREVVGEEEFDRAAEIHVVNPGDELPARAHFSAQPEAHKATQDGEDAVATGAEHHRGAEQNLARARRDSFVEDALPRGGDLDGEGILRGGRGTDLARLIPGGAEVVAVDGGGAGVEPHARRTAATRDGFAKHAGRARARIHEDAAVPGVIAAVDGNARRD